MNRIIEAPIPRIHRKSLIGSWVKHKWAVWSLLETRYFGHQSNTWECVGACGAIRTFLQILERLKIGMNGPIAVIREGQQMCYVVLLPT